MLNDTIAQLRPLKVDRSKLYTQAAYAEKKGLSRARINQMVKEGVLNTVEIKGATLILID